VRGAPPMYGISTSAVPTEQLRLVRVLTMSVWARHENWQPGVRSSLLRQAQAALVALQETVVTDGHDLVRGVSGPATISGSWPS
jgi:hypothetical protein